MWIVVGVLFALVLVALVMGFHAGPVAHIAAVAVGILAAIWLVIMGIEGRSAPILWALLSADVALSATAGAVAWKGLTEPHPRVRRIGLPSEGVEGVAVTNLVPEGIARVGGEQWSVVSVNGDVRAGTRVQVLRASGVRLDVWGEDPEVVPLEWTARLEEGHEQEGNA